MAEVHEVLGLDDNLVSCLGGDGEEAGQESSGSVGIASWPGAPVDVSLLIPAHHIGARDE